MRFPSFSRRHAAHHIRPVLDGLFAVERTLLAGEALAYYFRVGVDFQVIPSGVVAVESNLLSYFDTIWNFEAKHESELFLN